MKLVELRADLNERLKDKPEMKRKITAISKLQWIESSYDFDTAYTRLDEPLSAEEIQAIIKGEYLESRTVRDHTMINNYYDMVKLVYGVSPLKNKTDVRLTEEINRMLTRDDMYTEKEDCFRKDRPLVKEFAMVPGHPSTVREDLEGIIKNYNVVRDSLNPLLRGCFLHNELIKVYPFGEANEATARALLNFELICEGFLPAAFVMDKDEYRHSVSRYINSNDMKPFYDMMLRTLKQRYTSFLDMFP